jgi:hypothetical protein
VNVALPEPEHAIPTLGEIGVACPVALRVALLDRVERSRIVGRVGMPEVTIPLDDDPGVRDEGVHHEFAADDLLFLEFDPEFCQEISPCLLKPVGIFPRWESECSLDTLQVGRVIPASIGTIFDFPRETPSRHIEGFSACLAPLYPASSPLEERSLTCLILGCFLPGVRTVQATEADCSVAPRIERLAAPFAFVSATGIAACGEV